MILFPEHIPLFNNSIPFTVLEQSIGEVSGLTPCIVEINLTKVHGIVKIIEENNKVTKISLDEIDNPNMILMPAPLPLSTIEKIIFETVDGKKDFENEANLYSNVSLSGLKLYASKSEQKLFQGNALLDINLNEIKEIKIDSAKTMNYQKVYAFGGMIANLFYFSKNGHLSNEVFHKVVDFEKIDGDIVKDIAYITNYFFNDDTETNVSMQIYYAIIEILLNVDNIKEEIISFLEDFEPEEYHKRTKEISNRLIELETTMNETVKTQFNMSKSCLEKNLLMLFLRQNSLELIDYNLDIFSEDNYIQFAMLFGIRDKYINIPKMIREYEGIQELISILMAKYAHSDAMSSITFEESKNRPITLFDMLENNYFKKYFSKELNASKCFQTVVKSADFQVTKSQLVFDGVIVPKIHILEYEYFELISKYKLTNYNKFLQKYNKVNICK